MENIRFISTTYVQPKNQIGQYTKIELTPCDVQLLLVDTIQKGLLFHKPEPDHEEDLNDKQRLKLIEHLKASFSRTLDIFYPLAGRLTVTENDDDNTASFSVDCNGAGAQFVHAAADGVTVANILDPVYVPDNIVYSLFLMNGAVNYEGKSKPLLAVQVTELVDGIFIGLTMNHSAGDGTCFWNFFNTWSEISRSGTSKVAKPILGREFLDGIIHLPIRIPFFQYQNPEEKVVPPTEPLKQRVFHFRKEKIAELKSKANAQMGTSRISSLQALMGHLWVSITRTRRLISSSTDVEESPEITMYRLLVGMRQRLHPPLSDQYLGNAVLFGTATSTVGELLQGGLGCAAMELNKMIALQMEQEVKKFLEGFVENPRLLKRSAVMSSNSLATGSSPRFDVYGNDFGWGRPVAVRSGSGNKFDGKLTVFAGAEEGSIDFEVCLSTQTLQALAEDAEFMESVAV
ncbi:putative acetyltransferase [Rosa sericea]